jgi:hypothetical protein
VAELSRSVQCGGFHEFLFAMNIAQGFEDVNRKVGFWGEMYLEEMMPKVELEVQWGGLFR